MNNRTIRLCSLRAADGGARLVLHIEITTDTGVERLTLSPLVSGLDSLPTVGELTEEALDFLREESDFANALVKGYRYLGASDRSPSALVKRLRAAGVSQVLAGRVVEQLLLSGMLNESEGAVREAERALAKLWGDRRICAALREKGYSAQAIAAAVAFLQEQDSVARCVRLIKKRRMALPQNEQEAARFAAALVRYGYTGSEMKAAMTFFREAADASAEE